MPEETQLRHLICLLDDEHEVTQSAIKAEFQKFQGDVSDHIASLGIDISPEDRYKLSEILMPGRREKLAAEWFVPENLEDDWDSFEHLLRLLSDYMHDGISLRPSLHDSIDILVDEIKENLTDINVHSVRQYLFASGRFTGSKKGYYALQNSDLCYSLESGKGNPISLCTIFQFVGLRLNLTVFGCNYPGHYLAKVHFNGKTQLIDCFNKGRIIPLDHILENKEISPEAKHAISYPADARSILYRILRNMEHAFGLESKPNDTTLMQKLQASLLPKE